MSRLPKVTFIVVARGAAAHLPALFKSVLAQDYPRERLEFLFVDGDSGDGSAELAEELRKSHPDLSVQVLRNEGRLLACGWNVALARASGDVILRVDAHAGIPVDFVRRNVEALEGGRDIVGGPRLTILPDDFAGRALALAENSRFGGGSAAYRHVGEAGWVDTLAHAAYRRSVFARVGGYHELLARTEDNEIHDRMKRAGFRFWFDPSIRSTHRARTGLGGMLRQKWGNGYWIGATMAVAPGAFGLRHFVPAAFVGACALAALLSWKALAALLAVYGAGALLFAGLAVRGEGARGLAFLPLLPPLFLLIHLAYGLGTFAGLASLPGFKRRLAGYAVPRPIAAALLLLLAASARAGVYDVRAFGAKGDGKTDDGPAIAAAIAAAEKAGGGTVLLPAGRYKARVVARSGVGLAGEGTGATVLVAPPSDGKTASYALFGSGVAEVTVRDLTVVADGAKVFWPAGIRFSGSSGVRVTRVAVTGSTHGQGLVFDEQPGPGRDNTVTDSVFRDSDQGVVADNDGVRISGNLVENCKYGISLEYASPHEAVVSGNVVDGKGRAGTVGIRALSATSSIVAGNVVRGAEVGIYVKEKSARLTVSGNRVSGAARIGIQAEHSSFLTISGNAVEDSGGAGIHADSTSDSAISGNHVTGSGGAGVESELGTRTAVSGNVVRRAKGCGVDLRKDPGARAEANVVHDSGKDICQ